MSEPRAEACRDCGATHRPEVPCPPVGRWLISGEQVEGRTPDEPEAHSKPRHLRAVR